MQIVLFMPTSFLSLSQAPRLGLQDACDGPWAIGYGLDQPSTVLGLSDVEQAVLLTIETRY